MNNRDERQPLRLTVSNNSRRRRQSPTATTTAENRAAARPSSATVPTTLSPSGAGAEATRSSRKAISVQPALSAASATTLPWPPLPMINSPLNVQNP